MEDQRTVGNQVISQEFCLFARGTMAFANLSSDLD